VKPRNENAPAWDRGARKLIPTGSNAPREPVGKHQEQDWEDRRNAAACFKNQNKTEDWHADFLGVMVTEELPAGTKCWVSVRKRLTRNGDIYVSVVLKPKGDRHDVNR
jgi:hypothetical protein